MKIDKILLNYNDAFNFKVSHLLFHNAKYIFTGLCLSNEDSMFSVKFHNSDDYEVDIKMYDKSLNAQLVKSRMESGAEYSHEAHFSQNFFFVRSQTKKRLRASANRVTADVFEGCQFKAKEGRLILVNITSGNQLIYFKDKKGLVLFVHINFK